MQCNLVTYIRLSRDIQMNYNNRPVSHFDVHADGDLRQNLRGDKRERKAYLE